MTNNNIKIEALQKINSEIDYITRATENLYHGKVYALYSNRIHSFYKTKRGAEGKNNRLSNNSYYDEYTMEMVNCGGYEVIEILENEIADLNNIKTWYKILRNDQGHIISYNNYDYYINAAKNNCNDDIISYVIETMENMKNNHSMAIIEEYENIESIKTIKPAHNITNNTQELQAVTDNVTDPVNEIQEELKEVATEQENNSSDFVKVVYNTEKSGIELYFNNKPSSEVLEQIKTHGFRWSKFQKMWYAKDSEQIREFLTQIEFIKSENEEITEKEIKPMEYPEININDIEIYTVSKELSKRENDGHWVFRTKEKDHQAEIQEYLQQCNESVLQVLDGNTNKEIEYKLKSYLQYFKKTYYKNYIDRLQVNANNPSWVTTGRAGRNRRKDQKAWNRYDNLMRECCRLQDEFKSKLNTFKHKIAKEHQQEIKKTIEQGVNSITQVKDFKRIKKL